MDKHLELEYKFAADGVDPVKFDQALRLLLPDETVCVNVRDTYYLDTESDETCRHRAVDGGYQELTTKSRKSLDSLRERTEVNIKIDPTTTNEDVVQFMYMMGYVQEIRLDKPDCAVYSFHNGDAEVEVALYTVGHGGQPGDKLVDPRTFVEVEVSGEMDQEKAVELLDEWKAFLQETFKLGEPLNKSLFEMYSG